MGGISGLSSISVGSAEGWTVLLKEKYIERYIDEFQILILQIKNKLNFKELWKFYRGWKVGTTIRPPRYAGLRESHEMVSLIQEEPRPPFKWFKKVF